MTIELRLLGGFEATVDGVPVAPEQWTRRQAASLVKVLALAPGRRLHREQVIEALWPGRQRRRGRSAAAQGRALRASCPRRRRVGGAAAQRHGRAAARRRRARRRRRVPTSGQRQAIEAGTPEAADLALAEYDGQLLPDDLYEPWAEEARDVVRLHRVELLRQAERWDDVLAEDATDEAAHLALIRGHADRGDVRAALRQFERLDHALRPRARHHAEPRGRAAARAAARPVGSRGQREPGRPARRSPQRRRPDPRGDDARRRGPGQHAAVLRSAGVGKTAVLGLAEALAPPARLADRTRHGLGRRGAVALRAGARGVRRAVPQAPRPARRSRRPLPARDRAGAVRPGRHLDRRVQPPAAVRRGRRADAPGRDRPRAAARRRRPPGRRRGVAAAAALPVAVCRDRAGHHRGRAPTPGQRDRPAGRRESRTTRRRHAHRAGTARPRPPPGDCSPTASRTCRRAGRGDLRSSAAACRSPRWSWPATPSREAPCCCRACRRPPPRPSSARRCSGSVFTTDELIALSGGDEDAAYEQLEAALSAGVVEPAGGRLPVPARAGARALHRDDPGQPPGRGVA